MIKKLLLIATVLIWSAEFSETFAQIGNAGTCTPDISCMNDDLGGGRVCPVGQGAVDQTGAPRYDLNGKQPGLDTAFIGVPYSQTVSLKIPTSAAGQPANNGNLQGTSTQVIDFIQIYAMDNLPPTTTWACWNGGVTGQACGFTTATNTDPCRFDQGVTACIVASGTPDQLWDQVVRTHFCGRGTDLGIAANQDRYNDDYHAVVRCAKVILSGSQTICSGGVATLNVKLWGIAPFSLTWSDGTNTGTVNNILSGAQTNAPYSFTVSATSSASYSITALSSYSCTASQADEMVGSASVTVTNTPSADLLPAVTASSSVSSVCDGSSVILNYGGDAVSYVWANGVVNGQSFVPTMTDTYSVTGTGLNGCSKTADVTVDWFALPTVTATAATTVCEGSSVTLTGSGAATYSWDNGVTDGVAFSAVAGTTTYSVTGTSAQGCVGGTTTTVTGDPAGTVTVPSNFSACDAEVVPATSYSVSGTTYTWTNDNTAIGLAASGTGEVDGFTATNTTASAISGVVTVIPTLNNCPGTPQSYTITVNAAPTATISGDATVCSGTNAQLSVALTGTAPWSLTYGSTLGSTPVTNISTSPYTVAAAAGTYTLSAVSDGNSCAGSFSGSATIVENPTLSVSNVVSNCNGGGADYTVEFDITGGDPTTYTVTVGTGTLTASHFTSDPILSAVTYSFTVSDGYNCSPITVTGSKDCSCPAAADISGGGPICSGGIATLTVTLTGASPWDFTYVVGGVKTPITGQTTSPYTFTTNITGVYTLDTVRDANCKGSVSGSATVSQTLPTATLSGGNAICADGSTTNLNFAFTGTGPWDFVYTDGTTSSGTITSTLSSQVIAVSTAGTYSLTSVSDANCAGTVSGGAIVVVNALPTVGSTVSPSATVCAGTSVTLAGTGAATYVWSGANVVQEPNSFVPTGTFTYTVVGTDANNCSSQTTQVVNVNSLPTITTTASPSSANVCAGGSITLTGNGAVSYVYTGGSGTITNGVPFVPTAIGNTTITVTGTDANNCVNTTSKIITVNALPTVGVTATPASASVCSGSATTVTLSGTGASTYAWSDGISNGIAFTPTTTHTYTVTGTAINTCSNTATKLVTVSNCGGGIGIEEYTPVEEITIYPNPTTGVFNISILNASFNQIWISVFDITGKEVFNTTDRNTNAEYKKQINLGNLTTGMYYVRLNTGTDVKTKKLIIQ